MAIDAEHFRQIVACNVQGRALSAGYPDLLVPFPKMKPRPDSDALRKHHSVTFDIVDTAEVFKGMGLTLDVIDRKVIQGCERLVDLNENGDYCANSYEDCELERSPLQLTPERSDLRVDPGYELVIDPGTSEHCFNIAQALVNLADAVKVGGCIAQALPMAMFNHGYWNVNPVALLDFYEANGFKVEDACIRSNEGLYRPVTRQRLKGVPDGAVTVLTARRIEKRDFVWPQQRST